MIAKWTFLLLALLPMGCAGAAKVYVEADRLTYEAVAPEYVRYVEGDDELSSLQKLWRRATVETWKRRIDAVREEADAEQ